MFLSAFRDYKMDFCKQYSVVPPIVEEHVQGFTYKIKVSKVIDLVVEKGDQRLVTVRSRVSAAFPLIPEEKYRLVRARKQNVITHIFSNGTVVQYHDASCEYKYAFFLKMV